MRDDGSRSERPVVGVRAAKQLVAQKQNWRLLARTGDQTLQLQDLGIEIARPGLERLAHTRARARPDVHEWRTVDPGRRPASSSSTPTAPSGEPPGLPEPHRAR